MTEAPTYHNMQRRMVTHNYALPGIYHITLHVAEGMCQPLGQVGGSLEQPDNTPEGPHVILTSIGEMVRDELRSSITAHYSMVVIDTFVIMPEHVHVLIIVKEPIVSRNGRPTHLGQVIAGFKKGCNRRYWDMTGEGIPTGEPLGTLNAPAAAPIAAARVSGVSPAAAPVPGGSPARKRVSSNGTTGRRPLFAGGYCDVMPITAEQLNTQRAYINGNPRSRLLRTSQRATLMVCRGAYVSALTPSALRKYLQSVCLPKHATPEALAEIECRLLLAGRVPSAFGASRVSGAPSAARVPSSSPALGASGAPSAARVPSGSPAGISSPFIALDTYGARRLFDSRLLPVVCHYKDKARFAEQKSRCLEEAAHGAVLVSARIAPGEQEIMNEAVNHGFPVITIADNGFPERYHPSTERINRCADGKLLIVTPWQYQYRGKNEQLTIPFCKAMNCVVQALCRQKDDWWKSVPSGSPAPRVPSGSPTLRVPSAFPAPRVPSGSPAPRVPSGSPTLRVPSGSPAGNNEQQNNK